MDYKLHASIMDCANMAPEEIQKKAQVKVYLAGKFGDKDGPMAAKRDQIRAAGIVITHDWMTYERPGPRTPDVLGDYAFKDIQAVKDAHVVVFVMDDPKYAYRGSFTELGAALALGKQIFMYTPEGDHHCKSNVFWNHPLIRHYTEWSKIIERLELLQNATTKVCTQIVDLVNTYTTAAKLFESPP